MRRPGSTVDLPQSPAYGPAGPSTQESGPTRKAEPLTTTPDLLAPVAPITTLARVHQGELFASSGRRELADRLRLAYGNHTTGTPREFVDRLGSAVDAVR